MEKEEVGSLRAGDEVGTLYYRNVFVIPTPDVVDKITATQIVLASGKRFRRDNGRLVGAGTDSYGYTKLVRRHNPEFIGATSQELVRSLRYKVESMFKDAPFARGDAVDCYTFLGEMEKTVAQYRGHLDKLVKLEIKVKKGAQNGS